ncbi:hypothetical protein [Pseudogracilibacillus sp. SO30301A]
MNHFVREHLVREHFNKILYGKTVAAVYSIFGGDILEIINEIQGGK